MSAESTKAERRRQLQTLLRELFQFDRTDLDFGIYRILNARHDEIERFIEHDLIQAVEEGLAEFRTEARSQLQEAVEATRRAVIENLGPAAIDAAGRVIQYAELPVAQQYQHACSALELAELADETEAHILNDLVTFFARYYDEGDFLTERRYSSRAPKYAVPYNGEEVMLHWANRDQYYVKTTEHFTNYRFGLAGFTIWFRLVHADTPQDNVKGNRRYFVPRAEEPVIYDAETRTLTIAFEYRPLSPEEEAHYVELYNAAQPRNGRRKSLDRRLLCAAVEQELLQAVTDTELRARLAAVSQGQATSALGGHLNRYTARNTMDYFVHKDLGGFLNRELDYYLKNEVLRVDDIIEDHEGDITAHVMARLRVVRQIGRRIISFLAQIEDFQRRLFEKRKFVIQTDYCITLDRVPEAFYPEILTNAAQLEEWRRLYAMDAWDKDMFWQDTIDDTFLANHPYVMLDTAFFDADFKARLLASFDDLDAATDGLLIHGENFQALSLLERQYSGQVKCIYIDPPYNTRNDGFIYKDNYRHSSWLTMMRDRLRLSRDLLQDDGVISISIDDNEVHRLNNLLKGLYGEDNAAALLIARTNPRGRTLDRYIAKTHEYVTAFVKAPLPTAISQVPKDGRMLAEYDKGDAQGKYRELGLRNRNPVFNRENRPNLFFPIYVNPDTGQVSLEESPELTVEVYPRNSQGEDDCWTWGTEKVIENLELLVGRQVSTGTWRIFRKDYMQDESGQIPTTMMKSVWLDKSINNERGKEALKDIIGYHTIDFPKAVDLIRKCLELGAPERSLVMDFFAGSGTTAHAVMDLNREDGGERKYILVEMGDYFDTVLKPRIQKVAFSANWKDGVPQDRDGISHMFKYQRIESYEDALNNIRLDRPDEPQRRLLYDEFDDYMLHYMLDFESRGSPSLLAPEAFDHPFRCTLKIQRGMESSRDTVVDLVETFHYLIGMHVRRLERYEHQNRTYVVSHGEVRTTHGFEVTLVVWRDTADLDLEAEARWAAETLLDSPADRVYVNGASLIRGAQPLEIVFRDRMDPQD